MWNIKEALTVVDELEFDLAKIGFHCGLLGSVLIKGGSDKDLDILVYPHNKKENEAWATRELKDKIFSLLGAKQWNECEGVSQLRDGKEVAWMVTMDNRRIDLFFLS